MINVDYSFRAVSHDQMINSPPCIPVGEDGLRFSDRLVVPPTFYPCRCELCNMVGRSMYTLIPLPKLACCHRNTAADPVEKTCWAVAG